MMAEVPSGDPGGSPTSSPPNVMLSLCQESSLTPEFRLHTQGYKDKEMLQIHLLSLAKPQSLDSLAIIEKTLSDLRILQGSLKT